MIKTFSSVRNGNVLIWFNSFRKIWYSTGKGGRNVCNA